jgi:hypothetical protein
VKHRGGQTTEGQREGEEMELTMDNGRHDTDEKPDDRNRDPCGHNWKVD